MNLVFKEEPLIRAIEAIVLAGGSEPREARTVAHNLVTANLMGHDSHGIGMMPRYVEALLEGGLVANRRPEVKLDTGALLVLDGCSGYGQTIGLEATRMAIERAKRHGSSVTTLANSHHLGRIGHWAEMAVAEGLISMHFVNVRSFARVAAYGGADKRFGVRETPFDIGFDQAPIECERRIKPRKLGIGFTLESASPEFHGLEDTMAMGLATKRSQSE
jgi:uncharacterized oxidoreductase